MSQLSTPPHDTWIQPPPFSAEDDRRQSARVPTALKVRLGPAREPPSTTLLCEDVSEGGLFVRCGQAVQLGARFSVELTLVSGEVLYIPEAEVLYNVEGEGARRGFGARFVAVTREARQRLLEVARFGSDIQPRRDVSGSMIVGTNDRTTSRMRRLPDSQVAPAASAMPRVSDLRVATLRPGVGLVVPAPASAIGASATGAPASATVAPAPLSTLTPALLPPLAEDDGEVHGGPTIEMRSSQLPHDTLVPTGGFTALGVSSDLGASQVMSAPPLAEDEGMDDGGTLPPLGGELDGGQGPAPARRGPRIGGLIMGASGALVAGVLLAAYLGGRDAPADAAAPERIPGRVSGQIAGALTAPRASAEVAEVPAASPATAPAAAGKASGKAGALSKLDAAASARPASGGAGTTSEGGASGGAAAASAAAPAASATGAPAAPATASAQAAKPAKDAPRQTWKEALVGVKPPEAKPAADASKAAAKASPAAPATDADEPAGLDAAVARLDQPAAGALRPITLDVAPGTKVMRTHVLREPARFVVDLETSALPKGGAARVGRHDGFVRVVVDAPRALASGTAVVKGDRLVVTLTPR